MVGERQAFVVVLRAKRMQYCRWGKFVETVRGGTMFVRGSLPGTGTAQEPREAGVESGIC